MAQLARIGDPGAYSILYSGYSAYLHRSLQWSLEEGVALRRPCAASCPMTLETWQTMLRALGASPEQDCFRELVAAYAQPHRAYHTGQHVMECLSLLAEYRSLAVSAPECECALWFHDAIYEPMSKSNEERSAAWAVEFLSCAGVAPESVERIRCHVLATRHAETPAEPDSQLVVDIDLAILGAARARYEEFERQVRREYKGVPAPLYRRGRAAILQSFLDRATIYSHAPLRERFEPTARDNLEWALRELTHQNRCP